MKRGVSEKQLCRCMVRERRPHGRWAAKAQNACVTFHIGLYKLGFSVFPTAAAAAVSLHRNDARAQHSPAPFKVRDGASNAKPERIMTVDRRRFSLVILYCSTCFATAIFFFFNFFSAI
jgi:hypothetical protein